MDRTVDGLLRMYEGGSISRRALVRSLAALALGLPLRGAAQTVQPPIRVSSLNHVTCFVPDVERSVAFYQELFGMPILSDQGIGFNLSAGSDTQFLGIFRANSGEPRVDHICFGVENFEVDRIMAILQSRGLQATVRMRDGTVPEIYFTDPDGIRIQLQDPSYCGGSGELGNVCS